MQKLIFAAFLSATLLACSDSAEQTAPTADPIPEPLWTNTALVETLAGEVNGHESAAATWSWKGIPFAAPPLGELRFQAPQSVEAYSETLEASDFGARCVQIDFTTEAVAGDEDCLTLNVWRPQTGEEGLPVYVWIHGGGNTSGSADQPDYDGANLAAESNVVFVSLQYRLGPFGWLVDPALRTGDANTDSGNFGTLDLIAGLEWIQSNIAQFGGDPDNVIITGESAGGINVLSLLLSPQAEGLFHKAVSQSGFLVVSTEQDGLDFTAEIKPKLVVAEGLAATESEAVDLLAGMHPDEQRSLLINADPASIINVVPRIGAGLLSMPFIYADGHVISGEGEAAFSSGSYPNKVPLIMGTNTGDVRLFLFLLSGHLLADPPLYNTVADIGGKLWKAVGADQLANTMLQHSDQPPIFVYQFGWGHHEPDGSGITPQPWNYYMGASHALDIPFFLNNLDKSGFFADFNFTAENRPGREALGAAIVEYLQGFVTTGEPAGTDLPAWQAWSSNPGDGTYLLLDGTLDEAIIAMQTDSFTVESVLQELDAIPDPELQARVRAALLDLAVTCFVVSDDPVNECDVE